MIHKYYADEHDLTVVSDIEFNDGRGSQFKCINAISKVAERKVLTNCVYFESAHGKSKSECLGGVVKWFVSGKVAAEAVIIRNGKELFDFCCSNLATRGGDGKMLNRDFIYISADHMAKIREGMEMKRFPNS